MKQWLLWCWVVILCLPTVPQSKEREFPTLIALGSAEPIDSKEGLSTPIVFLDHESLLDDGTFRMKLETTTLNIGVTDHWLPTFFSFEYRLRGTAISMGLGEDIYIEGVRQDNDTFAGDSGALILAGHLFPDSPLRFVIEVERMDTAFRKTKTTSETFQLPPDFSQNMVRSIVVWEPFFGVEDATLQLTVTQGGRENWSDWGLDNATENSTSFVKQEFQWVQPIYWSEGAKSTITYTRSFGNGLDLLSGFRVGGSMSEYTVWGYYRNEYRVKMAEVINFSHDIIFAQDRILSFYGDSAYLEELDLEYLKDAPSYRILKSAGIGFRYGIQSLGGLLVILRYGEGFNVSESSKESHRREWVLVLAAGF